MHFDCNMRRTSKKCLRLRIQNETWKKDCLRTKANSMESWILEQRASEIGLRIKYITSRRTSSLHNTHNKVNIKIMHFLWAVITHGTVFLPFASQKILYSSTHSTNSYHISNSFHEQNFIHSNHAIFEELNSISKLL